MVSANLVRRLMAAVIAAMSIAVPGSAEHGAPMAYASLMRVVDATGPSCPVPGTGPAPSTGSGRGGSPAGPEHASLSPGAAAEHPSRLASTGASLVVLLVSGLLMVVGGSATVRLALRRRQWTTEPLNRKPVRVRRRH